MGEVYRARDTRLGREVAVKVLLTSVVTDPERLHRFESEARAAGVLNHASLLAVYNLGSHEGAPYIVSELIEGENAARPPRCGQSGHPPGNGVRDSNGTRAGRGACVVTAQIENVY